MTMMEFKEGNKIQSTGYVVQTFGRFDVIKDGRSLVMSTSSSKKIWELFKFMIAHRRRSFTPEDLMDQLWITEEYSDPRSTLRRQMHRLRNILNENENDSEEKSINFSNGHYIWNSNVSLRLDTDIFEEYIRQGDMQRDKFPDEALDKYLKALELYEGDYLSECIEQHWVITLRNQYHHQYLKTVITTIELLKANEMYDKILKLCQKALQIDIYEESIHIIYMDSLLMSGQKRQALEHYEYITGFYYREMGIKPSSEMREIYKKLLKTQNTINTEKNLYEELDSENSLINAFYCEPDIFKSIYELERRRNQRSGESFSIGVLTSKPVKGYSKSQEELKMSHLKQHLLERLRKGDTFTRWNEQQFVILLPGVDAKLTEKVLKRVLNSEIENQSIEINQIAQLTPNLKNNRFF